MKSWFTQANLPVTLIVIGLILNGIDTVTDQKVFGPNGWLAPVNDPLPDVNVPGTSLPINLGGWLVITGAIWLLVKRFS
jgi:hypothetical protein